MVEKKQKSQSSKVKITTKKLKVEEKKEKESNVFKSDFSIDLTEMLEAGVHFGHQSKRWHPKMAPYIWQNRDGVHILNLLKSKECLETACEAVKKLIAEGKNIIFIGTKRQAAPIVKAEAERVGAFYITSRWAGGTISNWPQVKLSIKKLADLKDGLKSGKFLKYTKKERVILDKEVSRLERIFGGIADLQSTPDALFIVDTMREKAAFREAKKIGIKIFALVDTNANPTGIDYPIPGNDDAVRSISLLVKTFADAVLAGKEMGKKQEVEVKK